MRAPVLRPRRRIATSPASAAGLAALLIAAPAAAEAPLRVLPETVVTATRIPTPIERIPAGVTVIDRATIEERGWRTLPEALAAVPGLRAVQSGGMGQLTTVFLRGTNSNHVLVLRDGMPINDPSTTTGLFDFGNDLLADVERIEVIRGPMSGLYGSAAIGGVVNLITRSGRGTGRAVTASGDLLGGSQATAAAAGVLAGEVRGFDYALIGEALTTGGFNLRPPRLAAAGGDRDGARMRAGTVNLGADLGGGFRAFAFGRLRENRAELDVSGDVAGEWGRNRSGIWRVGLAGAPFAGFETTLAIGGSRDDRRFRSAFGDDRYRGSRTVYQWDNTLRLPDRGIADAASIAFGLQRIEDRVDVRAYYDLDRGTRGDAAYLGGQVRLFRRLDLTANLRHEMPRAFADTTTWRLGGVIALPEAALTLHAAYGTSFRAPSLEELYGSYTFFGLSFLGNPDLRPETGRGVEVGVALDLGAVGLKGGRLAATYFRYRIEDLIAMRPAAPLTFRNINVRRAAIDGVETALDLPLAAWLDLRASYTWTVAQDGETGLQLERRPRHQGSLAATIRANPALSLTPEVLLFGPAADTIEPAFVRGTNPGGVIVNLTARWRATEGVELFALGRNVTNSRYEPANGFVIPGAAILIGLRAGI